MADGSSTMFSGPVVNLLGVYSGRISEESDLGTVWKVSAIREILESGVPGRAGLSLNRSTDRGVDPTSNRAREVVKSREPLYEIEGFRSGRYRLEPVKARHCVSYSTSRSSS